MKNDNLEGKLNLSNVFELMDAISDSDEEIKVPQKEYEDID